MHKAVRSNQPDILRQLLKAGANKNSQDSDKKTPLELALLYECDDREVYGENAYHYKEIIGILSTSQAELKAPVNRVGFFPEDPESKKTRTS